MFRSKLSQHQRSAQYVAAEPLPSKPIRLVVKNREEDCVRIDRVFLEDGNALVYWTAACSGRSAFAMVSIKAKGPDGTIIWSDSDYIISGAAMVKGERLESHLQIVTDPRITEVEISNGRNTIW